MAEAIALLGIVAAVVQRAQAAVQLLAVASSLRTRLRDAPDKVKRWLGQIEQLISLAEWMKQTEADLSPSSLGLLLPLPASSGGSAVAWVEAALLDCTNQAQSLQELLKSMLHEVDHRRGQSVWKTILTVARERSISNALDEIERQKNMLNIWLGQNNLRQFNELHRTIRDARDGVEMVDQHMLHMERSFREEFQSLSTESYSTSISINSGFDSLRNLGASSVNSLRQQMQQHDIELQSESSATQLQFHDLMHEMRAVRHVVQRLATPKASVSRAPTLLTQKYKEPYKTRTTMRQL